MGVRERVSKEFKEVCDGYPVFLIKFSSNDKHCTVFIDKEFIVDHNVNNDSCIDDIKMSEETLEEELNIEVDVHFVYDYVIEIMRKENLEYTRHCELSLFDIGNIFVSEADGVTKTNKILVMKDNRYHLLIDDEYKENYGEDIKEKWDHFMQDNKHNYDLVPKMAYVPEFVIDMLCNKAQDAQVILE